MQAKTTRAFRTISEAGEELDLQPHVLRFWESKFPQIKPIKRGGGRRFYRPEDIELIRGIKILLHDEKHPIKDVQKLLRLKGPQRIIELGQSVERAAKEKAVSDTVLIPERIKKTPPTAPEETVISPVVDDRIVHFKPADVVDNTQYDYSDGDYDSREADTQNVVTEEAVEDVAAMSDEERNGLVDALIRLKALRANWDQFKNSQD